MAATMGDLIARFTSQGYGKVSGEIDNLTNKGNKAQRATDDLASSLRSAATGFLTLAGAAAGIKALVDTNREFNKLRAGLVTATGGVDGMNIAWTELMQFAKETPYGIQQVTESFTKLVNYGLTPSREALIAYGDTASAMSKSLDQMIEAVADAATGEFERLKEFGIKARNEGDVIKFTFRGTTTAVKNSASDIERYLIDLGKTNFSGAMKRQMDTLDGDIANLSDTWDQFKYNMSDGAFADAASFSIRKVIEAIDVMNANMESGKQDATLEMWSAAWAGWGRDVDIIMNDINTLVDLVFGQAGGAGKDAVDDISNYWSTLPASIRAHMQMAIAHIKSWALEASALGVAAGKTIANALNPFGGRREGQNQIDADLEAQLDSIRKGLDAEKDLIEQDRLYTIAMQESLNHGIAMREDQFKAEQLRKEKDHQDKLAQFRQGGDGGSNSSKKDKKQEDEFKKLLKSLDSETEAVERAYKERVAIIKKNTEEGSKAQEDLLARATAKRDQEMRKALDSSALGSVKNSMLKENQEIEAAYQRRNEIIKAYTEAGSEEQNKLLERSQEIRAKDEKDRSEQALARVEQIKLDLMTEEEALLESYDRRKKIVLENEELTAEQRTAIMEAMATDYQTKQRALMLSQVADMAGYMQSSLGVMTQALSDAGAESNTVYKMLFAAQKAMAIPSMIVATEEGAAKALALGPIVGPPAAMAIRALGYASVGMVAGQAIAGLFDQGGIIPAGKSGIVGEFGPELVNGPAVVTSRRATMDKINSQPAANQASYNPTMNFYLNGTGMGDKQLESLLKQAAQEGGRLGYREVLEDVNSRGQISRRIGR